MNEIKTIKYYNEWAREFTIKQWGMKLNINIELYSRKSSRQGFLRYSWKNVDNKKSYFPLVIKMNVRAIDGHDEFINVLKHELCHWYCMMAGLNFKDGDKDFEEQLNIVGARSTMTSNDINESLAIQEAIINDALKETKFKTVKQSEIEYIIKKSKALSKWTWLDVITVYNVYYKDMQVGLIAKCSGNTWIDLLEQEKAYWMPTRKGLANQLVGNAIRYMKNK